MKRFYKNASFAAIDADAADDIAAGYAVLLDDRPVKTPDRKGLIVPNRQIAAAIAAEWNMQDEQIDPRKMPFTGMANAAIDKISADPDMFINAIAAYGDSDTLCYRADPGEALAARQDEKWEPLLKWAEAHYGIGILRIAGIMHRPQAAATLAKLRAAVARHNPFMLAPLSIIANLTGSLIATLALAERAFAVDVVWDAAWLEEYWQEENWGEDYEAAAKRAFKRTEFDDAIGFFNLIHQR